MEVPFSDITLYTPIPHKNGTKEYIEDTNLQNFVSDLYVQMMHGYKPPETSRITIQPAYHNTWSRTWKTGSIVAIAPYYNYDDYATLDRKEKYRYILDVIQVATLQLSDEYKWDKGVFDKAYKEIIESNFHFKIPYPAKKSRNKKKVANLSIEKNETVTYVYANIESNGSNIKIKLFEKANVWWYDPAYVLARQSKWFNNDKFGICFRKKEVVIWYSIEENEVRLFENGNHVKEIDFKKHFLFG